MYKEGQNPFIQQNRANQKWLGLSPNMNENNDFKIFKQWKQDQIMQTQIWKLEWFYVYGPKTNWLINPNKKYCMKMWMLASKGALQIITTTTSKRSFEFKMTLFQTKEAFDYFTEANWWSLMTFKKRLHLND